MQYIGCNFETLLLGTACVKVFCRLSRAVRRQRRQLGVQQFIILLEESIARDIRRIGIFRLTQPGRGEN